MDRENLGAGSRLARRTLLVLLVGAALAGALAVLVVTRWGIGTTPDSATYLGVADNIRHGLGWTVPFGSATGEILTQFPPLYSWFLAISGEIASDLGTGGRGLQALLMAANTLLVAAFLRRVDGGWAPLVGVALMLTAPPMILIHSMAWSEPLFILLGFSGFLALAISFEQTRRRFLWAAAVLIGLACLTRLAGVAFLLAGEIAILLDTEGTKRRVLRAAAFGIVAGLPTLMWVFWSAVSTGSLANRTLGVHFVGREQIQSAVGTMAAWLFLSGNVPGLIKAIVLLVVGLGIAALLVLPSQRARVLPNERTVARPPHFPPEVRLVAVFFPTYVGVLALATSFLDANVPWDDRILSPLFVSAIILGTAAMGRVLKMGRAWKGWRPMAWMGAAVLFPICVWGAGYAVRSVDYLKEGYTEGLGFRHQIWRDSETLTRVNALPRGIPIYSNSPEAIYLYTGRAARALPREDLRMARRANPDFPAELDAMRRALTGHGGAIVYFDAVRAASYPTVQELREALDPVSIDRAADGVILTLTAVAGSS